MTGSLTAKHGKYYVVVRVPNGTGGMKTKWINTGVPTEGNHKREAQKKRLEILAQLEEELKQAKPKHDTTLAYYVNGWLEGKDVTARPNTVKGYRDVNQGLKIREMRAAAIRPKR